MDFSSVPKMMMSEEAVCVNPSSSNPRGASTSNSNPNPNNPNSNSVNKRKRSLPGTPDPNAEVIALSPKSLMATNRFMCEVCGKGFQRDQNLQLHRRGHNLPWKLKQRASGEVVRKKVYVCPEKSCVHNDPSRALGDLTGIKKHFSRKHGEKKWKCDKCSKKYAVQSDWKAHTKICGTREYRCDCGTLFSRKDSFLTHRAFCDALAERSARIASSVPAVFSNYGNNNLMMNAHQAPQSLLGFNPEFGGPDPQQQQQPLMGNFADADHSQKLMRLPLWLDHHQQANNMNPPLSNNSSGQWGNCRYPEVSFITSSSGALPMPPVILPQGVMKLEPQENKVDLSHSVTSLYPQEGLAGIAHMSMESTRINGNNVFGSNNVVEIQKLFKQANIQAGNFNDMVNNSQASSSANVGEWQSPPPQPQMMENKQVHYCSSSNNEDLTRDFLGVGDHEESLNRSPFLLFNPIGPAMNLQTQFGGHY